MAPTSINAEANLATAKTVLSTAASVAATVMLVRSIAQDLLPPEIPNYFFSIIGNIFNRFSSKLTVVINEFNGLDSNEIYEAAEVYLATKISPSIQRLKVSKPEKENKFTIAMESNEQASDMFNGVKFDWILVCQQVKSTNGFNHRRDINSTFQSEVRSFELTFHKKHRDLVLNSYLPHIVKEAKSLKQEMKTTKIFTIDYQRMYGNPSDCWISINLDHPSTFETLAMESKTKDFILRDLEQFLGRKEFYKKVGKAWKRGYLLYGPPGTGKSSLIAAMANYLNFNIYDLELTQLDSNDTLRRLLLGMANRSILVVEDIDCTVEFQDRDQQPTRTRSWNGSPQRQVTLSGLLNFIDGLWSSCGDERIIVFTTNQKDKLDSALLRPGRMDVHVHMSYCTPSGFHLLASNYLGIKHHSLFQQIEDSILTVQVTPAEVAEQLLKGGDDCDNTLLGLIEFLEVKKRENKEAEAKKLLLVEAEEADIKEIECKKENEVNSDTSSS